ncbi:hypothetical protein GCM10011358_33890 [Sinisalibacter lacisalsi]|uniref:CopL family metal-binding regulatory protein n=2 Tax=Sinisalibacter lacisalsi TaxID=1526570 RepID=A0ABQ1QXN4_9RHOB|nr:hypothetical protein GCM10011358_33890 [Sinisalibacter lacisalsi]
MDNPATRAYPAGMIERFAIMLAILAITVSATVTSAHAARMGIGSAPDHAAHLGEMVHAPDLAQLGCDGAQNCGSADSAACAVVCAGLSAFLTLPDAQAARSRGAATHDLPPAASHIGRAPGLNERPPKLRFL